MFKRALTVLTITGFAIFCFLLMSAEYEAVAQTRTQEQPQAKTQIVLLGTGTPNAEPERSGPSVAIVVKDTPYLVDFGPGVVRRAAAAAQSGVQELRISNLKRAFVTHLHSDHTAGYPDLILTPWVEGRNEPLDVYGPPGIMHMTEHILAAYEEDIAIRIYGLEHANRDGYKVNVYEIEPGVIYADKNVTVKAFAVNHGSWEYAYGYRFETPDRIIVISGDTTPSNNLVKNAQGCDVLIHEVYSEAGFKKRSEEWQRYHADSHTSTYQLAEIANRIKPKLLILYHQLMWGSTPEEMLAEIAEYYKGKVVFGNDLEVW